MTTSTRRRKTGVSKGRIRLGRHDETILEAMYRWGGLTREQAQQLIPAGASVTRQALRRLRQNGLVDETVDLAAWQERAHMGGTPKSYYYLSSRYSYAGIVYGAVLAGVEKRDAAIKGYKRHQNPARVAHSSLRNSFFLQLRQEAQCDTSVEAPEREMWGEAHPGFPLRGGRVEGRDPNRKNARKLYRDVYPDGRFEMSFGGEAPGAFFIEVETEVRSKKLRSKVNDYAGYCERLRLARPVVILMRTEAHAESALAALDLGRLSGLSYWSGWASTLESLGAVGGDEGYPGEYPEGDPAPGVRAAADLMVVSSYEEIAARGSLADVYLSLSGREVSLREVAARAAQAQAKLANAHARAMEKEPGTSAGEVA